MPRLILPLSLSAAAFALAWWAGSLSLNFRADAVPGPGAGLGVVPLPAGRRESSGSALTRRSAELLASEHPDAAGIQRIFSTGHPDPEEVRRLAKMSAEADPEGLWRWLQSGGHAGLDTQPIAEELFTAWFRKNPKSAMAAYRSSAGLERYAARNGLLRMMFGEGAKPDASLMPYVDEMLGGNDQMGMPAGVRGGAELVSILSGLPEGKGRDALLRSAAGDLLRRDWQTASAWADQLPEPLKSKMMETMMRTAFDVPGYRSGNSEGMPFPNFPGEALKGAIQWFADGASPEMRFSLGPSYVGALAKTDPAAALTWAGENLDARVLARAVEQVLKSQAFQDPAAARAVVESLPPGGVRERAVFQAVPLNKLDAESVSWLMAHADKSSPQWGTVADVWAAGKPDELRQYLASADPKTIPKFMLHGAARGLLRKDAPGTLEWAVSLPSPAIASTALDWWAVDTPGAAAVWLKDHTATEWSPESLTAVSKGYFKRDPEAAVDWAASLPAGSTRDTAIQKMQEAMEQNTSLPATDRSRLAERLGKQ